MAKFKVLRGKHSEGRDGNGKPLVYLPGDVVETDKDLEKHNAPALGPLGRKFERVPDATPATRPQTLGQVDSRVGPKTDPVPAGPSRPDARGVNLGATLEGMDVKELKALADAEEIDLKGVTRREDMVALIKKATGAK